MQVPKTRSCLSSVGWHVSTVFYLPRRLPRCNTIAVGSGTARVVSAAQQVQTAPEREGQRDCWIRAERHIRRIKGARISVAASFMAGQRSADQLVCGRKWHTPGRLDRHRSARLRLRLPVLSRPETWPAAIGRSASSVGISLDGPFSHPSSGPYWETSDIGARMTMLTVQRS
jgi:hypothetical protein